MSAITRPSPSERAAKQAAEPLRLVSDADWPDPAPLHNATRPAPLNLAEAFPDGCAYLREFAEAVGTQLSVAPEFPAAMMLPLLSVAIAGHAEVSPWEGWKEPAALWVCGVMPPAERKSAVLQAVYGPLSEWEAEQADEQRPIVAEAQERLNLKAKRLEMLRSKAGTEPDAERDALALARELAVEPAPTVATLRVQDSTPEALGAVMLGNGGRAIVASAESDPLDVVFGRYSGAPNLGLWLAGHAGDPHQTNRRGRQPEHLKRPALSVALAVQPEGIRPMLESREAAGRGFTARFLFVAPESKVGSRPIRPPTMPDAVAARYRLAVRAALNLGKPGPEPAYVRFTPDAARMFEEYGAGIEANLSPSGGYSAFREWAGKLHGAVARIALALHAAEFAGRGFVEGARSTPIGVPTVLAAAAWGDYFASHFPFVCGIVGVGEVVRKAEKVLEWADRTRPVSFIRSDVLRTGRAKGLIEKAADLNDPLELLCSLGHLRALTPEREHNPNGGRPAETRYVVNPKWIDRRRTPAPSL